MDEITKILSKCGKLFEDNEEIFEGFLCQSCYGKTPEEIVFPDEIPSIDVIYVMPLKLRRMNKNLNGNINPKVENTIDFLTRLLYRISFSI